MFHLLSNSAISSAIRLWLFIRYRQSGFNDRERVSISIKELSEGLSVSRSSIQNWQRLLIKEGYLEVTERKSGLRSNLTNLYRACLPKHIQSGLQKNKISRKKSVHGNDSNEIFVSEQPKQIRQNIGETKELGDNTRVYVRILNDHSHGIDEPTVSSKLTTVIDASVKKNIGEMLDKLGSPKWLTLLYNGTPISLDPDGHLWLMNVPDHAKKPLMSALNMCKSDIKNIIPEFSEQILLKNALCTGQVAQSPREAQRSDPCATTISKQNHQDDDKTANTRHAKSSAAKLNHHTRLRIYDRLSCIHQRDRALFTEKQINALIDQISYSMVHGSLSNCATNHGINIALKLIRENRWLTPKGYSDAGPKVE
jgi:hypothetical protein